MTAAFPSPGVVLTSAPDERQQGAYEGMSLRDYFAAKALPIAWEAYDRGYCEYDFEEVTVSIAKHAYQFADAMLKAREL